MQRCLNFCQCSEYIRVNVISCIEGVVLQCKLYACIYSLQDEIKVCKGESSKYIALPHCSVDCLHLCYICNNNGAEFQLELEVSLTFFNAVLGFAASTWPLSK